MQHFTERCQEQSFILKKTNKEVTPMKRGLIISFLLCSLLLSACNNTSVGVIGGADDPTSIIVSNEGDNWGITLRAENVTKTGMTLKIEQFGGNPDGELETGEWFKLEKTVDDNWTPLETNPLIDYAWNDVAYEIKRNDITELPVEWKWLYGELESGFYRLTKEIVFRSAGSFDKDLYEVYFTVEEES